MRRFLPPSLWPRSLAGRTAVVLVAVLVVAQGAGLTIHALDRVELLRLAEARDLGAEVVAAYRAMVVPGVPPAPATAGGGLPDEGRPRVVFSTEPQTPATELPAARPEIQQLFRPHLTFGSVPQGLRPRTVAVRGDYAPGALLLVGVQAPDERWLVARVSAPVARPWHSRRFLVAFALMTLTAAAVAVWAVRRLTAPVRVLAGAAERLGLDVDSPPLPEDGPEEVRTAAVAFNTMAARIRRFVSDRTFLLTAIGHDLRTPITRLKLRAEWVEDPEQRRRMLADLDELEGMVSAALTFGRDVAGSERATRVDLAALLRTVVDEASDARAPGEAGQGAVQYAGPETMAVLARPMALKRAAANLVSNALAYAGQARVVLHPARAGLVAVDVEDDGPGIPSGDLERVFEPFQRLEGSRNRETGGMGLGLPIVRNIMRAHGGDAKVANRAGGGLRATLLLPV